MSRRSKKQRAARQREYLEATVEVVWGIRNPRSERYWEHKRAKAKHHRAFLKLRGHYRRAAGKPLLHNGGRPR